MQTSHSERERQVGELYCGIHVTKKINTCELLFIIIILIFIHLQDPCVSTNIFINFPTTDFSPKSYIALETIALKSQES